MEAMALKHRGRLIYVLQNYGPVKVDREVNLRVRRELRSGELATLYAIQDAIVAPYTIQVVLR